MDDVLRVRVAGPVGSLPARQTHRLPMHRPVPKPGLSRQMADRQL